MSTQTLIDYGAKDEGTKEYIEGYDD